MRSGKPATPAEIDGVLTAVEGQIEAKGTADPRDLGFWKVVGTVKRDPTLTDRFAVWFAVYRRPQPGGKTDYATYLRTPARSRARIHESGAIVTKVVPSLLLLAAILFGIPAWAIIVPVIVAVGQVIADVAWSTKPSDWAKYKREMTYVA
jgi:hypothetical protein